MKRFWLYATVAFAVGSIIGALAMGLILMDMGNFII